MSDYPPPGQPGWGSTPPPPPPPPGGYGSPPAYGAPPPGGYGPPGAPPTGPAGYSVGDAFNYAWRKFQANVLPLVLITLAILVAAAIIQVIGNVVSGAVISHPTLNMETGEIEGGGGGGLFGLGLFLSLLFGVLSFAVNLAIQAGIIKASLALTRGQRVDLGTAFNGINWGQVLLTVIIIAAATLVGLVLCILPGIAVAFFTSYALYFVIDRNQDAVTAIKSSFAMVKDNIGPLILFFLASIAAYIVGACLCGVGLLAAIPIVVLAQAYTFRTLNGETVTA